jgi:hypothetical protein
LDARILAEAKAGFLRRRHFWLAARVVGGIAAAAAVVLVAIHLFVPSGASRSAVATNHRTLAQAADINQDGRVDILDAYILAQKIQRHEALDPAWDLNGDGVVDQKDVDLIAGIAVQTAGPEATR